MTHYRSVLDFAVWLDLPDSVCFAHARSPDRGFVQRTMNIYNMVLKKVSNNHLVVVLVTSRLEVKLL